MGYDFELTTVLAASPLAVYDAWMTSDGHSAMTGAEARVAAETSLGSSAACL